MMCVLYIVFCFFIFFLLLIFFFFFFFFFQAEDGIRDRDVTGVQTCALPISPIGRSCSCSSAAPARAGPDEAPPPRRRRRRWRPRGAQLAPRHRAEPPPGRGSSSPRRAARWRSDRKSTRLNSSHITISNAVFW